MKHWTFDPTAPTPKITGANREREIYERYGSIAFNIPIEFWDKYEELETIHKKFYKLCFEHLEDLKCYALMHYDINFYRRDIDIIHKAFFVEKENEIVGYKERLTKDESLKSKVVQLYYDYEPLFHSQIYSRPDYSFKENSYSYESYIKIKNKDFPNIGGIDKLTNEQCKKIIDNKINIINNRIDCNIESLPSSTILNTRREFIENFIIPCFFSPKWHFRKKHIVEYVERVFKADITHYVGLHLELIKNAISLKEKISKYHIINNEEIDKTRKEVLEEHTQEYNNFIKELEGIIFKDQIWQSIFENLESIESFLSQKYNDYIKELWLRDSDNCRAYLVWRGTYAKLVETFIELEKEGKKYLDTINPARRPFGGYREWISNITSCFEHRWKEEEKRQKEELKEKERRLKKELEKMEKQKEKFRFNLRNAHLHDNNIKIHPLDHTYTVNGIALDSVTQFINNAFPKFDSRNHAKRKAEQLGISINEVLDMWERKAIESRELGTKMHSKIENYYLGHDSEETDAYKMFKIFANRIELNPYRTEWAIYDWDCKIAGTVDFVDYQHGDYIIYDWKRSDKIIENGIPIKINRYGEKGNYPLEHLDNSPYYHYALQLSFYKYILEKNYGLNISELRLGIFHPAYNKPYILKMPYLEKEITDIVKLRSEEILF